MGFYYKRALRPLLLAVAGTVFILPAAAQDHPVRVLTLDQVIARALEKSPVLAASGSRENAATANIESAGAMPNPALSVEAENIFGDGPYEGFDGAEITYGLSQQIELAGKRGSRIDVAGAEKDKSHFTHDAARLDLIRDVTIAYVETAAARQDIKILEEERALTGEVYSSVAAKVDAGKEPPIQKSKAGIEQAASDIALERARRNLETRKSSLSVLMGGEDRENSADMAGLPALVRPAPLMTYRARLPQTLDVLTLGSDIDRARSELSLEKAHAVPDPTINVGLRDFRDDNAQALVAGVSFPLPVFNLNRGGIERAGHELNAAMMDQRSVQLSLEGELVEAYGQWNNAYEEATVLQASILPGAEEAFRIAREGYQAGKFDYLEVLDAQRTLFDARRQYNTAVLDYHRQRAVIERLTALHEDQHQHETNKEETNEIYND